MVMATEPRCLVISSASDSAALTSSKESWRASARVSISRCCKRRRSGWVIRFELIEKSKDSLRLSDVTALYTHEKHNIGLLRRAIEVATLPES